MNDLPRIARYSLRPRITAREIESSSLYGPDKFSLMFNMVKHGPERDYEVRVSLGMFGGTALWAVMWFNAEIHIEMNYLDQDCVEGILQAVSNEFKRTLFLESNDNYMLIPAFVKPGVSVLREV